MVTRLVSWADAHRGVALDLLRVYLGLGLLVRGVLFLSDPSTYVALLPEGTEASFSSFAMVHYVGLAHVGGGLLLMVGLLTRLAALSQLPILIVAALVIHLPAGVTDQSFAFAALVAALVAALLGVFAVWGGGHWSLDHAVDRWSARQAEDERDSVAANVQRSRSRTRLRAAERAPIAPEDRVPACACGHARTDAAVSPERIYSAFGRLRFATGTHPLPARVVFRCRTCDGVVEDATDTETLEAYRYFAATEV